MKLSTQVSKQFREVLLNGDWVVTTNYKSQLSDLNWKQATIKIGTLNTIAALTFHVDYYISGMLNVFKNGKLEIRDKYSFNMPPIKCQKDWENLLNKILSNAEEFAKVLEQMPDEKLEEIFVDEKYGNYFRNINSLIEHSFYHLGQIVLIKKLILQRDTIYNK